MQFPSRLIEDAVNAFATLPGIGKKTALRLVMHLLQQDASGTKQLSEAILKMRTEIKFCKTCHTISDAELCTICASPRRDHTTVCVVEESKDVMAIENTSQYTGIYHVLGGIISPIQGVGPGELNIDSLIARIGAAENGIKEVILALSSTMEGDTTAFYLHRRLKDFPVKITSIARGIPMGGDLEYADEITLGRSITARVLFH